MQTTSWTQGMATSSPSISLPQKWWITKVFWTVMIVIHRHVYGGKITSLKAGFAYIVHCSFVWLVERNSSSSAWWVRKLKLKFKFTPYCLPSLNGIQWLMSLCGLNTSPSLLWVLNSSHNKVIKSPHTWLKVQVFTSNNFLSPWHSQGSHWMLNISKNQYVHMHIWKMLYHAPFCIKPLLFKDILEFSSLTVNGLLDSLLDSTHQNANPCSVGIQGLSGSTKTWGRKCRSQHKICMI